MGVHGGKEDTDEEGAVCPVEVVHGSVSLLEVAVGRTKESEANGKESGEGEEGGGALDFFRSLCAHEKMPPLFCFGGTGRLVSAFRSTSSFESDLE